jgi:hypothetical protein
VPHVKTLVARKLDDFLGFGVVPKISLGYFDGKPCVVTEWIESTGAIDSAHFQQSIGPLLMQGKRMDDQVRIILLNMIMGNMDVHANQFFFTEVDGVARMQMVDFDQAGGSKCQSVTDFKKIAGNLVSVLPDKATLEPIAKKFLAEADPKKIRSLAEGLWSEGECDALEKRAQSVVDYVRKTMKALPSGPPRAGGPTRPG